MLLLHNDEEICRLLPALFNLILYFHLTIPDGRKCTVTIIPINTGRRIAYATHTNYLYCPGDPNFHAESNPFTDDCTYCYSHPYNSSSPSYCFFISQP